jgi:hypothetical protein
MEAINAQDQVFTGEALAAQIDEKPTFGVTDGKAVEAEPLTDAELLAKLEDELKTKKFQVLGLSPASVRWLNNFIRDKAKFTGVEDAYFLTILAMDVLTLVNNDQAANPTSKKDILNTVKPYEMRALTIKLAHYFLSKNEGTGLDAAQKFLAVAQPINNALTTIQPIERQVKALQEKLKPATPAAQA